MKKGLAKFTKTALPRRLEERFCVRNSYFFSKLSQQVQLSASQEQVFPIWILRKVQKSPALLYLHSVTLQPMLVFTS